MRETMATARGRDRIGIEFISAFGMAPVEFIALADRLGCGAIGFALAPIVTCGLGYPHWSLRGNPALAGEVKRALGDHDVRITLGEGFLILPGKDIADARGDMDLLAELGAERFNICVIEPDMPRRIDQFARFAELAAERGRPVTVEFLPGTSVDSLAAACALIDAAGQAGAGVLLDAMHFFRTGGSIEHLRALDPALIGYAQICDLTARPAVPVYADEARYARLCPGEGELPLAEFVAALPADCHIGLEVPERAKAEAGIGAEERLAPCIAAARALLAGV